MNDGEAAQESLQIFYEWLQEMTIADAELAIKGIEAYMEDLQRERDIENGWHQVINRYTDTDQQE